MTSDIRKNWTFLSNSAHVLICLAQRPPPTTREMAIRIGITERTVQRIVSELITAGIVNISKTGRRNRYTIDPGQHLRHALVSHKTVGEFISLMENEILADE